MAVSSFAIFVASSRQWLVLVPKRDTFPLESENPGKIHDLSHFVYTDFLVNRLAQPGLAKGRPPAMFDVP